MVHLVQSQWGEFVGICGVARGNDRLKGRKNRKKKKKNAMRVDWEWEHDAWEFVDLGRNLGKLELGRIEVLDGKNSDCGTHETLSCWITQFPKRKYVHPHCLSRSSESSSWVS